MILFGNVDKHAYSMMHLSFCVVLSFVRIVDLAFRVLPLSLFLGFLIWFCSCSH